MERRLPKKIRCKNVSWGKVEKNHNNRDPYSSVLRQFNMAFYNCNIFTLLPAQEMSHLLFPWYEPHRNDRKQSWYCTEHGLPYCRLIVIRFLPHCRPIVTKSLVYPTAGLLYQVLSLPYCRPIVPNSQSTPLQAYCTKFLVYPFTPHCRPIVPRFLVLLYCRPVVPRFLVYSTAGLLYQSSQSTLLQAYCTKFLVYPFTGLLYQGSQSTLLQACCTKVPSLLYCRPIVPKFLVYPTAGLLYQILSLPHCRPIAPSSQSTLLQAYCTKVPSLLYCKGLLYQGSQSTLLQALLYQSFLQTYCTKVSQSTLLQGLLYQSFLQDLLYQSSQSTLLQAYCTEFLMYETCYIKL